MVDPQVGKTPEAHINPQTHPPTNRHCLRFVHIQDLDPIVTDAAASIPRFEAQVDAPVGTDVGSGLMAPVRVLDAETFEVPLGYAKYCSPRFARGPGVELCAVERPNVGSFEGIQVPGDAVGDARESPCVIGESSRRRLSTPTSTTPSVKSAGIWTNVGWSM